MDGLRCIDDFTTKCLDEDHRAYFNTLYTGTTQVIMDLCKTGEYQTEYLKHARCMRNAQTEYESCVDIYQLRIKSLNKVRLYFPKCHYYRHTCINGEIFSWFLFLDLLFLIINIFYFDIYT